MANPNYTSTTLLVHGTGDNDSTTALDLSLTPKTFTANGNAKITTAIADPFGNSDGILTFDGTGDYFSTPDDAELTLSANDFTLRTWVRFANYPVLNGSDYASALVSKDLVGNREFYLLVYGTASSLTTIKFAGFVGESATIVSVSHTFSLNTWYLVECVRSGNLLYIFVDGTLKNAGGTAFTITINDKTTALNLGALNYNSVYKHELNGQLSGVELIPGVALHTASYTPPTAHTPAGTAQLEGNITEGAYSYISKWLIKAWKSVSNSVIREQVVTGTTYLIYTPTFEPHIIACSPYIDGKWESGKTVTAGQFYVPANPETTPYLWEVTTGGDFDTVEATWNLSGTTTQGTAILTFVGALPNPSILGPKIPS